MPFVRRPVNPRFPYGNLPAPFPGNRPNYPIGTTVLPNSLIPATIPTKIPMRHMGNHPAGTFLTVPTIGPLPPVQPSDPTILPSPMAFRHPAMVPRFPYGPMLNPGVRIPVRRR